MLPQIWYHIYWKHFYSTTQNQLSYQAPDNQNNNKFQAYLVGSSTLNDSAWCIDNGATNHVTYDLNNLSIKEDYKGKEKLTISNGQNLKIFACWLNNY